MGEEEEVAKNKEKIIFRFYLLHKKMAQVLCNYCGQRFDFLFIADFRIFTKPSYILSQSCHICIFTLKRNCIKGRNL